MLPQEVNAHYFLVNCRSRHIDSELADFRLESEAITSMAEPGAAPDRRASQVSGSSQPTDAREKVSFSNDVLLVAIAGNQPGQLSFSVVYRNVSDRPGEQLQEVLGSVDGNGLRLHGD